MHASPPPSLLSHCQVLHFFFSCFENVWRSQAVPLFVRDKVKGPIEPWVTVTADSDFVYERDSFNSHAVNQALSFWVWRYNRAFAHKKQHLLLYRFFWGKVITTRGSSNAVFGFCLSAPEYWKCQQRNHKQKPGPYSDWHIFNHQVILDILNISFSCWFPLLGKYRKIERGVFSVRIEEMMNECDRMEVNGAAMFWVKTASGRHQHVGRSFSGPQGYHSSRYMNNLNFTNTNYV